MEQRTNLKTDRTTVKRIPDRGAYDAATVYGIIDRHFLCHVGFVDQGAPFVIPTAYCRIGDFLYIHGSSKSRMMGLLAAGHDACITITHMDGLVLARSAFHHSINYRSVVIQGKAMLVSDEAEKNKMFEAFVEHVIPGRWAEVRWPNEQEMKATHVVKFPLTEASAKVRTGDPKDDAEDMGLKVWAGVLPLKIVSSGPQADTKLEKSIPIPAHIASYVAPWSREQK